MSAEEGTRGPLKGPSAHSRPQAVPGGSTELVPAQATPRREGALCPLANTGILKDLDAKWPAPALRGARVLTPRVPQSSEV